jgi:hypothetical protein
MMSQNTQKNYNGWSLLLKWTIALSAVIFIYVQLRASSRQDWWAAARMAFADGDTIIFLFLAVALLPVNLSLEALKWQTAMTPLEAVRFSTALRAVFSGMTVSVFTPNRIGEYAGRVFVLQQADRIAATVLTVVSSFSQLVITVLAGSIAVYNYHPQQDAVTSLLAVPFLVVLPLLAVGLTIVYFRIDWMSPLLQRLPLPASWKSYSVAFTWMPFSRLLQIFFLAVLRYVVFTGQFFLLLKFFHVSIAYTDALTAMAVVYLAMLIVPTVTLTELGVRGGLAVAFFAGYTEALEEVVFASSLLWLINLILPSLLGCLFVFKFKFFRVTAA